MQLHSEEKLLDEKKNITKRFLRVITIETNNAEIAALAAPRPIMVVSDGKYCTHNVPAVEFPYIKTFTVYIMQQTKLRMHILLEKDMIINSRRGSRYINSLLRIWEWI